MRLIATAAVAAFLLSPAVSPAQAHHARVGAYSTAMVSYAAATSKKVKKSKKTKAKKEQYMRAVPSK